jgi:hypothetical protein
MPKLVPWDCSEHMAHSGPWDADAVNSHFCQSTFPRVIFARAACQQVTPAAHRRVDLRATPATLAGVPGRPTRASAVSNATETTVSCEKCRDRGTAQSIVLPTSVAPIIVSFFVRFSFCGTQLTSICNSVSNQSGSNLANLDRYQATDEYSRNRGISICHRVRHRSRCELLKLELVRLDVVRF